MEFTALALATSKGHVEVIRLLLMRPDIDARMKDRVSIYSHDNQMHIFHCIISRYVNRPLVPLLYSVDSPRGTGQRGKILKPSLIPHVRPVARIMRLHTMCPTKLSVLQHRE